MDKQALVGKGLYVRPSDEQECDTEAGLQYQDGRWEDMQENGKNKDVEQVEARSWRAL